MGKKKLTPLQWLDQNLERYAMIIFLILLYIIVLLGIITRVIGHPLSWTEEASRLCFVWMIFLGMSFGTRFEKHIRVTIIPDKIGKKFSTFMTLFWDILTIIIFLYITFYGAKYIVYSKASKTFALQLNKGLTSSIIAISGALNIIRTIQMIIIRDIPEFKEPGRWAKIQEADAAREKAEKDAVFKEKEERRKKKEAKKQAKKGKVK